MHYTRPYLEYSDLTPAMRLAENVGIGFQGMIEAADRLTLIGFKQADAQLTQPEWQAKYASVEPGLMGRTSSGRLARRLCMDFGMRALEEAQTYVHSVCQILVEPTSSHLRVSIVRKRNRSGGSYGNARPATADGRFRALQRFIVTPAVSKHQYYSVG